MLRRTLLACGVLSSGVYVTLDFVTASSWGEYSMVNQTVSELSAIGAPTRPAWLAVGLLYDALLFAFAIGVLQEARGHRTLRVAGWLTIGLAAISTVWKCFPIHLRGELTSVTDTIHAGFAGGQVLLTLSAIILSGIALGGWFRRYAIASIAVMVVAGASTFFYLPRMAAQMSTPGIGIVERVNVYGYLLWISMFAMTLLSGHATGFRARACLRTSARSLNSSGAWTIYS